jgi:predicted membrane-bound spermidine synthase
MKDVKLTFNRYGNTTIYLSVALVSLSILMLEIGLARIFSVMFESHYVFLVISLAILGLGLGGVFVHMRMAKSPEQNTEHIYRYIYLSSGLMAISILLMVILIMKIPFFQNIYRTAFLSFIPFFFGGMFLSTVFRIYPEKSSYLYAADLLGASIGSILIVFFLRFGGINISLLVATIASIPACIFIFKLSASIFKRLFFLLLPVILILTFILDYTGVSLGTIPFSKSAHKEMAHFLGHPSLEANVADSRWSAFGRTDLIVEKGNPDEKLFFIDGSAGTAMYRFNKDIKSLDRSEFTHFSGYLPFELLPAKEKKKVLIIGPGGGREVLISLLGGAKEITAVEVNKDLVDLMKKYSDFNGGIYSGFPGVKVVVEEGRNFIRSTKENYDIIMLSIPITKTSRSPEGFALTENFLFTVESINDYLDRLNKDGRLVVVAHKDFEIFRLVFTGLSALKKRGIPPQEAMKHIYTVGPDMFPVFVLKKSPLTPQEANKIHENMHAHKYSTLSSFIPFVEQETHYISLGEGLYKEQQMLNDALYLISKGQISPDALAENANFNLKAVSDNDPFFYKFELGLPSIITTLLVLTTIAMIGGWLIKPGYLIENGSSGKNFLFLILFSFLGIGFMLIEIPLIQKFMLFLGQPTYSVAVLLFSILMGAGIGSWSSGFIWKSKTLLKLRIAVVIVSLITGVYIFLLNPTFTIFLGDSFFIRILVSFTLLFPLGFFLGMPFPLGMKLLDEFSLKQYVPRMWGVNGIGSVLGSTLAIALAISYGFSYAMSLGAVLYFSLFIIFSIKLFVVKIEN